MHKFSRRFLNNKFNDSYTPTIENFYRKVYRIRGEIYQLDILDTSGNHPFPAMQRLSFITGLFIIGSIRQIFVDAGIASLSNRLSSGTLDLTQVMN